MTQVAKTLDVEFCKELSNDEVLFGYAIVCKELNDDGDFVEYFDTQGDHITEDYMKELADEYMFSSRVAKFQHDGEQIGLVLHSFPMTEAIAKSLGVTVTKTGWLIGMRPDDPAIVKKFKDGNITGFSIGGYLSA